jgi:hypothetical protein
LRSDIDSALKTTPTPTPPLASKTPDTATARTRNVTTRQADAVKPQLALGRDSDELDDASLRALLAALDEIDRGPVAPSAEPDPSSLLPVIRDSSR